MRRLKILSGATIAIVAAASLTPSIAINIGYVLNQGGEIALLVLAIMSVLTAPLCLTAFPKLYEGKRFDLMAAAAVLFVLALSFNVSNALALVGGERDSASNTRKSHITKINLANARLLNVERSLADSRILARNETPAMIRAELLRLTADPIYSRSRQCGDVTLEESKLHCGLIANTKRREAAAEQVVSLTAEQKKLTAQLSELGAGTSALDPKTDRVARLINLLVPISNNSERWVGYSLDVLTALLVECLGAFLPSIAVVLLWPTKSAFKASDIRDEICADLKPTPKLKDQLGSGDPELAEIVGSQNAQGYSEGAKLLQYRTIGRADSRKKGQSERSSRPRNTKIPESVRAFCSRCVVLRKGGEIQAKMLYGAYSEDCVTAGITPVSHKVFGLAMAALGYEKKAGRVVVYQGIALRRLRPALVALAGART